MDPETTLDVSGDLPQELLAWHKPEIQHIRISLDTADGLGSHSDGFGGFDQPSFSDARVKQDISAIPNPLQGILAVHGAQELQQMYPEVAATRKDGSKAMNYALLVPVLVEAIKQQQAMIADLQAQVKELH